MTSFNALIADLARRINARPHANGLREARLLVEHVSGHSVSAQIVIGEHGVPQSDRERLEALTVRREAGEPLARLLGKAAFWDFEVALNDATLIPRDDTGALVEAALARLDAGQRAHVADLGTGSGIVLLALARERPALHGVGVDVSPAAVEQAQANAKALGLDDQISFQTGHWLEGVEGPFDMVVSNPPYIRCDDMAGLSDEVRLHDPSLALVAGVDGLDAYRVLLPQAACKVKPGGFVLVEHGAGQGDEVARLGAQAGLQADGSHDDLRGQRRVQAFKVP